MDARELLLFTPLTPEQVAGRLQARFAGGSSWPLEGRVNSRELVLFRKLAYRNSFKPGLYARLEPTTSGGKTGTLIRGRFGPARFVRAFMAVWVGFLLFIFSSALLGRSAGTAERLPEVFAPLGMLVFGVLLWCFGHWVGREDPAYIREQLARELQGSEVGAGAVR